MPKFLSKDEYIQRREEWFAEQGPNTGNGFFGKWGWYARKENELIQKLKEEGYVIDGIEF